MAKRPQARPASLGDFLREFRSIQVFKEPPRPIPTHGRESAA
ncbi:MAG: hypothetical protein WD403_01715 [Pirellulales bacterium]